MQRPLIKFFMLLVLGLFVLGTASLPGQDALAKEDLQDQPPEKPRPKRPSSSPA